MNSADLHALIPHRPPFLFIDAIVEIGPKRIVARKRFDHGEAFFDGHYPGNPIVPGVLLCECAFQAGAALLNSESRIQNSERGVPVLTRIREAKFKQLVRPGQVADVEVTFDEELDGAYYMTGRVSAEGKLAVRVEFVVMMTSGAGQP